MRFIYSDYNEKMIPTDFIYNGCVWEWVEYNEIYVTDDEEQGYLFLDTVEGLIKRGIVK